MRRWPSAGLAGTLLGALALGGCGGAVYTPRPSPRIQVVPDGSSLTLVKNGHSYPFSVLGGSLEEVVQGNPRAEEEARIHKNRSIAGFVLSTVGTVGAGVGAGMLVGNELRSTPSSDMRAGALGLVFGSIALSIVGSVLVGSAQPHLWNAINLYNDGLPAWGPPVVLGYPAPNAAPAPPLAPGQPFPGVPLPATAVPASPPAPAPAPVPERPAPSSGPTPVPAPRATRN